MDGESYRPIADAGSSGERLIIFAQTPTAETAFTACPYPPPPSGSKNSFGS